MLKSRSLTYLVLTLCLQNSIYAQSNSYQGYGEKSLPAETVAKYAPKPLKPETKKIVQKYTEAHSPGRSIATDGGKTIYFNWRVSGNSQIWKKDSTTANPIQLTTGSEDTNLVAITKDQQKLIVSKDLNGKESPGLYFLPVKGGDFETIFAQDEVVAGVNFIDDKTDDIYFTANVKKKDSFAILKYDAKAKKSEVIFDQDGAWNVADIKDDGTILLNKIVGSMLNQIYEWNPKNKKLSAIFDESQQGNYSGIEYAKQQNEILVITDKLSDFAKLYRYNLLTKKFTSVTPDIKGDVEYYIQKNDKSQLFYHTNENGYYKLYSLETKNYSSLPAPKFTNAEHILVSGKSKNERYYTIRTSTSQFGSISYIFDSKTKQLTEFGRSSLPGFNPENFVKSAAEEYKAEDGTMIPMFVYRPKTCNKPCPVVIHFHGGPEAQSTPGFNLLAQMFVEQGFVYVEPNVRGSSGYGKKWLDSDNKEKRLNVIGDIRDAALHFKQNESYQGKQPKVGVMGWSYGGYASFMAMSYFAGTYDAGIPMVGMSNLVTFMQNTAPYRRIMRANEYGDPEKDAEFMKKLSPSTYVDKIKDPMLVIQGLNDPRVPAGEAVQMHELLQSKNIKSELIIFADEGHGAGKKENRLLEQGHILEFFNTHLKK